MNDKAVQDKKSSSDEPGSTATHAAPTTTIAADPVTTSQDWKEGDPTPSEVAEELRVKAEADKAKAAKESAKEA